MINRHNQFQIITLLIFFLSLIGCSYNTASTDKAEVKLIELSALPENARFISTGSVGVAFWLTAAQAGKTHFPVPKQSADLLLVKTIRLYHFDEKNNRWDELSKSYYDVHSNEVIGMNLRPGIYSAFGWSVNPVENAMQRIILDASLGYGESLSKSVPNQSTSISDFRRFLVQIAIPEFSFTFTSNSCQTKNEPDCPEACRRAAGRIILNSCRVEETVCVQPRCCDCVEATITERFVPPPVGPIATQIRECNRNPNSPLCPLCPNGLSCPGGPFTGNQIIAPSLSVPDYSALDKLGLGVLIDDVVLRESLKEVVEGVIGVKYPVPPPWP